ncbi:MAG TPA: sugar transferase [Bacteroidales bacterium]|nr:sugar transferase [Bacteroidales bacterium]
MKRLFDVSASVFACLLLLPFFCVISLIIMLESRGGIYYSQQRVGKNNKDFKLLKFRTMRVGSDKHGLLTVGDKDARITRFGYFLRKYKLDELPQLFNILKGDMSIVGPRPEVRKYVDLYDVRQRQVLSLLPGLTDYASLAYISESEILSASDNPEQTYIDEIMPRKIELNLKYIQNQGMIEDMKIIFKTLFSILKK